MAKPHRRKHSRVNALNLAEVHILDDNGIADCGIGRTLNVSEAGVLLETYFPIEPDQILDLTIALGDDILEIKGQVIYSRKESTGKYQNGVKFTGYDKTTISALASFVKGFNGNEDILKMLR